MARPKYDGSEIDCFDQVRIIFENSGLLRALSSATSHGGMFSPLSDPVKDGLPTWPVFGEALGDREVLARVGVRYAVAWPAYWGSTPCTVVDDTVPGTALAVDFPLRSMFCQISLRAIVLLQLVSKRALLYANIIQKLTQCDSSICVP